MVNSELLHDRRQQVFSPGYRTHYDEPLHVDRAVGATIWDKRGKAYLDCYNNVPSVGHCHPQVVKALHRQAATINTHSRYLDDQIVMYAERLLATLPEELDTCAFVCTGTEANNLAYEIARSMTGRAGVVVSDRSYHGNAGAAAAFSLYNSDPLNRPDFVRTVPHPSPQPVLAEMGNSVVEKGILGEAESAVQKMARSEHGLAMLMIDPIFDAAGIYDTPAGYLEAVSQFVRAEAGVVVIDEVQSGLTRLGDHMWGFQKSGIIPDLVTMGKPMAGGYPLGIVAGRRELFEQFSRQRAYFNTFAGTPVAGAVGNAVLDVIEGECIQQSVCNVGQHLHSGLEQLRQNYGSIWDIRGRGLFLGLEVRTAAQQPDPDRTTRIVNAMRNSGVLVSSCGPMSNVLKIRPPLVFSRNNADQLLSTLELVLDQQEKIGT